MTAHTSPAFTLKRYTIRRNFWSMLGRVYYFEDETGQPFGYVRRKILTWKEKIRVFTDESMTTELLRINARNIIDFMATFDVEDATTGERVGAIRRRGFKSLVKDEWTIFDNLDREIGIIVEDSLALALIRRFLFDWIPQTFHFEISGQNVGEARQNWNFFAPRLFVDFSANQTLDPRLAMAGVVLLISIERRQDSEANFSVDFGS